MKLCIADNLKMLRTKNGYTLEALAEIISVSRQTIAKWEAEESYPDITNCMKLASLYKVSLDELVSRPLIDLENDNFRCMEDKIGGVLDISPEGMIKIPETVMQMFDLKCGEKVMLLADKKQGIALVKCSIF